MKKLTKTSLMTMLAVLMLVAITFVPNLYAGDPNNPVPLNPDPGGRITCPSVGNLGDCHQWSTTEKKCVFTGSMTNYCG